eukprot:TRINITY_DN20386_c0_g1_i1.p1 TRINITY_DN20386_c0_g1~~TRINITY_DN20386_c0_g1_i1.p1  ORF type:complete len:707 (+),score=234.95 TRINITY_DN20386_c0_g1_i1:98-2122(+)
MPRPMNMVEKILCHHAVGIETPEVRPGQMVCVKVQWTLAQEITLTSIAEHLTDIGRPPMAHPDRLWLAVEHTVDPRNYGDPKRQKSIKLAEDFVKANGVKEYQGVNQTIVHTEFYRQAAQPGQIVVGADSHSCSAGGLGAFAIGLGAADTMMPMVAGETWLEIPEVVRVRFTGSLPFGVLGKDAMLRTLGMLKCNTVANQRAVEWADEGGALSMDDRFAISNMSVEFGAVAGVFAADAATFAYVQGRQGPHKGEGLYFAADEKAEYVASYDVALSGLAPQVALCPSPDNVVPVDDPRACGMELDGCFIGACTTGEQDLIIAGLLIEQGLRQGLKPCSKGTRRVTPGSVGIVARLRELGLIAAYEAAGFTVGAPGCSYCAGVAADTAAPGEVWLASQNRNYHNRMGKGSTCHLSSAPTVAASSFAMRITDPRGLLAGIDQARCAEMLRRPAPGPRPAPATPAPALLQSTPGSGGPGAEAGALKPLRGRAYVLGDNVDTDAILPSRYLMLNTADDLGPHCLEDAIPEFREGVSGGRNIIVAGSGFGCGSSREQAVTALAGAGVQCVIAKSFSYIFMRNCKSLALLGIPLADERFHKLAAAGGEVTVCLQGRTVSVGGESFPFQLSLFEQRLLSYGGIKPMWRRHGKQLFRVAVGIAPGEQSCGGGTCSDATDSAAW